MSTKRASYSSEVKVKVVLELLANELTLAELASKYNITTKNIQNWKKIFLDNAVIAMEPAKTVKEYKSENDQLAGRRDQANGCVTFNCLQRQRKCYKEGLHQLGGKEFTLAIKSTLNIRAPSYFSSHSVSCR